MHSMMNSQRYIGELPRWKDASQTVLYYKVAKGNMAILKEEMKTHNSYFSKAVAFESYKVI